MLLHLEVNGTSFPLVPLTCSHPHSVFPKTYSLKSWFLSRIVGVREIKRCSLEQSHEMDFNRHTWISQQNHWIYVCPHHAFLHCTSFWFQPAECCHRKEGSPFIYDLESEWVESIRMKILVHYRDKWLCCYDPLLKTDSWGGCELFMTRGSRLVCMPTFPGRAMV